jgi:hypothetical protein
MQKTKLMATGLTLIIKPALRGLERNPAVMMQINETDTREKDIRKKQKIHIGSHKIRYVTLCPKSGKGY